MIIYSFLLIVLMLVPAAGLVQLWHSSHPKAHNPRRMSTPNETPQETVVWRGTPSQWTNFTTYLFCLLLAGAVVAGYMFVSPPQPLDSGGAGCTRSLDAGSLHRHPVPTIRSHLQRVKVTTGLLSRHTNEIELYRVRDYSIVEPFWLRLVGCGNIVLMTADASTPNFMLRAVPHAATLKDRIRTNTERMRQRRGVRSLEVDSPDQPQ